MQTLMLITKIEQLYTSWGNIIVFLGSLVETTPMGFTIPGGLILSLGGYFSFGKSLNLVAVIISGTLGMLTTFIGAYFLGQKTGFILAKKFHQEKYFHLSKRLLEKNGPVILTTSLLANLTRFWVAYAAGSQNYNFIKFIFYALTASLTWNSLFISVGYIAGSKRQELEGSLAKLGILSWGIVFLVLAIIYLKTKKERKDIENNE